MVAYSSGLLIAIAAITLLGHADTETAAHRASAPSEATSSN